MFGFFKRKTRTYFAAYTAPLTQGKQLEGFCTVNVDIGDPWEAVFLGVQQHVLSALDDGLQLAPGTKVMITSFNPID